MGDETVKILLTGLLPASVKDIVRKSWAQIKDASGKPVSYK